MLWRGRRQGGGSGQRRAVTVMAPWNASTRVLGVVCYDSCFLFL